jgi:uncharacterized membrane protein
VHVYMYVYLLYMQMDSKKYKNIARILCMKRRLVNDLFIAVFCLIIIAVALLILVQMWEVSLRQARSRRRNMDRTNRANRANKILLLLILTEDRMTPRRPSMSTVTRHHS